MFICNCTLASPSKCFNCKNYSTSFFYGTSSENWFKYMGEVLGFDSDRYELVEKKDWKINQLRKEIDKLKKEKEMQLESMEIYRKNAVGIEQELNKLTRELIDLTASKES